MADKVTAALPAAVYANVMRVSHTSREFFFDFGQATPDGSNTEQTLAVLVTRIATSPGHAKAMLDALKVNVEKYEDQFGEIRDPTPTTNSEELQ